MSASRVVCKVIKYLKTYTCTFSTMPTVVGNVGTDPHPDKITVTLDKTTFTDQYYNISMNENA